jgi:uracil DNA glycosylase
VVIFVGVKAAQARPYLDSRSLQLLTSDHPSPLVRAKFPDRWRSIPVHWANVHQFLT